MRPVAEAAARAACRWLTTRGFHIEERIEDGPGGKKLNAYMIVRRDRRESSLAGPSGRTLPTWDWAGQRIPREDAWLRVIEWFFLEGGDGPDTVSNVETMEKAPGWIVEENKRTSVPKLRFSTLEEFVVKAAAAGL